MPLLLPFDCLLLSLHVLELLVGIPFSSATMVLEASFSFTSLPYAPKLQEDNTMHKSLFERFKEITTESMKEEDYSVW